MFTNFLFTHFWTLFWTLFALPWVGIVAAYILDLAWRIVLHRAERHHRY